MSELIRILDYLYLTRPVLFFPGWATLLAGYLVAAGDAGRILPLPPEIRPLFWHGSIVTAMLSFAGAMGGCFILNQLQDVDSDRKNQKLFLLGDGLVPLRHGYIESALLLGASLLTAIACGLQYAAFTMVFILVTGYLYNYPPFRFKDYPLRGLVANMLMGWLAFMLGGLLLTAFNSTLLLQSLPYLAYNTALYFLTTIPDREGDAAVEKVTFPVRYGFSATLWISSGCYLLAVFLGGCLGDQFLLIILAAVAPFWLYALILHTPAAVIIALKMGIFFFSIGVCIKFPLFGVLIIATYYVTRFYYKRRFNFDYPNFKGR